jgi:hypothetical protein
MAPAWFWWIIFTLLGRIAPQSNFDSLAYMPAQQVERWRRPAMAACDWEQTTAGSWIKSKIKQSLDIRGLRAKSILFFEITIHQLGGRNWSGACLWPCVMLLVAAAALPHQRRIRPMLDEFCANVTAWGRRRNDNFSSGRRSRQLIYRVRLAWLCLWL